MTNSSTENNLFEKITDIRSLNAAWKKVKANRGSAGIDQVSWFGFEQLLDANLAELSRNLRTLTYQPLPARFVQIAKSNGKTRELGILTIRDRVAQRAVLDVIEPIFESDMQDCSYAFRPNRSIEMAIHQVILNRANGNLWTMESDIQNYFAEIDHDILLTELREKIADENILHLIKLWIDAGALKDTNAENVKSWWQVAQTNMTEVQNALGETFNESIDQFVASKLGLSSYETDYLHLNPEVQDLIGITPEFNENRDTIDNRIDSPSLLKRKSLKKLLESGLWYAVSNRAMFAKFLGIKAFGIGGAVLAGGLFGPRIYDFVKDYYRVRKGVLQGSPISPLLANIYLNKFDRTLTNSGFKLIRYCDDFVISCRSQAEAEIALQTVKSAIAKLKLALHPEKTQIVAPNDDFEFLGFQFSKNGIVKLPSSVPEKLAEYLKNASNDLIGSQKIQKLKNWECILKIVNRKR